MSMCLIARFLLIIVFLYRADCRVAEPALAGTTVPGIASAFSPAASLAIRMHYFWIFVSRREERDEGPEWRQGVEHQACSPFIIDLATISSGCN